MGRCTFRTLLVGKSVVFQPCFICLAFYFPYLLCVLCKQVSGGGGGMAAAQSSALSAMNVDAVCEKLKHIEGINQSMLAQYTATIRKVSFFNNCDLTY